MADLLNIWTIRSAGGTLRAAYRLQSDAVSDSSQTMGEFPEEAGQTVQHENYHDLSEADRAEACYSLKQQDDFEARCNPVEAAPFPN